MDILLFIPVRRWGKLTTVFVCRLGVVSPEVANEAQECLHHEGQTGVTAGGGAGQLSALGCHCHSAALVLPASLPQGLWHEHTHTHTHKQFLMSVDGRQMDVRVTVGGNHLELRDLAATHSTLHLYYRLFIYHIIYSSFTKFIVRSSFDLI